MFLQQVKEQSPTMSGMDLVPMMAGTVATSVATGQVISRAGKYRVFPIAGTALAALSLVLLSRITPMMPLRTLMLELLLLGMGIGMVSQVLVVAVQNAARLDLIPAAAWLLLRLEEQRGANVFELGRAYAVPRDRVEAGLTQLLDAKYVTASGGTYHLTPSGCDAYDRLSRARRERLTELYGEWPAAHRAQLATVLQRLAADLVPARAA